MRRRNLGSKCNSLVVELEVRTVFLAMIMVRGQDVEAKALAEASRTSKRAGPIYGFLQSTRGCKLPSA